MKKTITKKELLAKCRKDLKRYYDMGYVEGVAYGYTKAQKEKEQQEKPDLNDPVGWIMKLNNEGQLTVHEGSLLSFTIQQLFGVKHEMNVFRK